MQVVDNDLNILLVDDKLENLFALESILADSQHQLIKVTSGKDALRYLFNQEVAVILMDVNMPIMDGFETAQFIRERSQSKHTPIIFITASHQSESELLKAYEIGAVDFIYKPIVPTILRSKVAVFI